MPMNHQSIKLLDFDQGFASNSPNLCKIKIPEVHRESTRPSFPQKYDTTLLEHKWAAHVAQLKFQTWITLTNCHIWKEIPIYHTIFCIHVKVPPHFGTLSLLVTNRISPVIVTRFWSKTCPTLSYRNPKRAGNVAFKHCDDDDPETRLPPRSASRVVRGLWRAS